MTPPRFGPAPLYRPDALSGTVAKATAIAADWLGVVGQGRPAGGPVLSVQCASVGGALDSGRGTGRRASHAAQPRPTAVASAPISTTRGCAAGSAG